MSRLCLCGTRCLLTAADKGAHSSEWLNMLRISQVSSISLLYHLCLREGRKEGMKSRCKSLAVYYSDSVFNLGTAHNHRFRLLHVHLHYGHKHKQVRVEWSSHQIHETSHVIFPRGPNLNVTALQVVFLHISRDKLHGYILSFWTFEWCICRSITGNGAGKSCGAHLPL